MPLPRNQIDTHSTASEGVSQVENKSLDSPRIAKEERMNEGDSKRAMGHAQ
jgi:hypothetical protein